jgi:spoIIIJ-associated protein
MKDRVFTGASVPEALAEASEALGLPETQLRYVVLDAGTPAERGLKGTPARVAVLLEDAPPARDTEEAAATDRPEDPRAGIREIVREVSEAAGIDVWAEIEEEDDRVVVRLEGPDQSFFYGHEGRGDVLRATEHLLQRIFGAELLPRPLRVECRGFQERRDAALADEARSLAAAVRESGQPQTTEPLNGYERRIVHLALNEEPGVKTYSVGEGGARRVTVAPAGEETPPAPSETGSADETP